MSEICIVLRILRIGDCEPGNRKNESTHRATVAKTVALRNFECSLNEVFDALKSSWMRADPSLLFNEAIGTVPIVAPKTKMADHY
jgi:hypothetical protein